jgi:hypothetical protein
VADRTPYEDVLRRAYDANVRYWETVGRATTDYLQAVSRLWTDASLRWQPEGIRTAWSRAEREWADGGEPAALVLEGAPGTEARAAVMLSNDLGRDVEASVVASVLVGPGGESTGLKLRTDPQVVRISPGSRVPVTLIVGITDELSAGIDYRGEVNVPGLSTRGVPVIVRRLD